MAESAEAHLEEIRDTVFCLRPDLEAWVRGDATLPTATLALYVPDVEFLLAQLDRQREVAEAAQGVWLTNGQSARRLGALGNALAKLEAEDG